MNKPSPVVLVLSLALVAATWIYPIEAGGDPVPYIATGLSSFGTSPTNGVEEPSVLYYPDTNSFTTGDTYTNIVDEGGGMIRETLRNYYSTLGWWDGDRNLTDNTAGSSDINRSRAEVKRLGGTSYQQQTDQTYEYSYDFRTNPEFYGTTHFCHIFQLKANDETGVGSSGNPLVTLSLYKSGGVTLGRLQYQSGDNNSPTVIARTFTFTPGQWIHAVVRISTTSSTENTGVVMASINGDAFSGASGLPIYRNGATTYYNKWGFYRGMGTDYGVPEGDSWIEDRTMTLLQGTTNILKWQGGVNGNAWDLDTTQNWLNGSTADIFRTADQISFDDTSTNNTVNLVGTVSPNYTTVNAARDYTFSGTGKISGGTLVKKGTGTLTLATSNDYPGLTLVQAGTLLVTGSVGNNSLVNLTGGTLRAGSSTALGNNSTIGTTIDSGTLDVNGQNLSTELITVKGTGVGGNGAIYNSDVKQLNALKYVTLSGDVTFGGAAPNGTDDFGRWDVRGSSSSKGTLSTNGQPYKITKLCANQVAIVHTTVDSALGNLDINQGIMSFESSTTSMGDSTKTVTIAAGASLKFYTTTAAMNKKAVLNGGEIIGLNGSGTNNTFTGPITVNGAGGVFTAGDSTHTSSILTLTGPITGIGGVTKNGPNTVFINGTPGYAGSTTINEGILQINTGSPVALHAVAGAGALGVGNTTAITVDSINIGTLTIGAGSKLTIAPLPGGPLAGIYSITPVPEPATFALLLTAVLAGLFYYKKYVTVNKSPSSTCLPSRR